MKKLTTIVTAVLLLAFIGTTHAQSPNPLKADSRTVTMGVGFGVPYGVLGTNTDISFSDNFSSSMGLGTTILSGMAYNFGMRFFLAQPASTFRPRISAFYGVNSIIESGSFLIDEYESFEGITLGFGAEMMFGSSKANGLDFDIMYIATTGYDADELRSRGYEVSGGAKISLGYRHAF
ncbi:MAG: hypothetical protein NT002_00140 [candidate division Zixibacteria bacterium]|nr:hypothetical protein [candidate division Zixibacteria bacterium]